MHHKVVRDVTIPAGDVDFSRAKRHGRECIDRLKPSERIRSFAVIDLPYGESQAKREADRCLRCAKAVEYYKECWYCLPCEIECPTEALLLEVPFLVN